MDTAQAPAAPSAPAETVDLLTLVGQFTALRQEVNLQTRAVRTQQEQNAESLALNQKVFDSFQETQQRPEQQEEEARQREMDVSLRPLLKAMVDVADYQLLTIREMTRAVQTAMGLLPQQLDEANSGEPPASDELPQAPAGGFFARLFGVSRLTEYQRQLALHQQSRQHEAPSTLPAQTINQIGRILESALAGLDMGLQRMDRAMRQFGLEPILCVGQPFDPERMEVVEVVADSDGPPGAVIDEVRRGYVWKGKVFRFAQVRVST
jgi:molecular chaperone GrpE